MEKSFNYDLNKSKAISPSLYGLFLEDINFAVDGGLNNNQIANCAFNFQKIALKKDIFYLLNKLKEGQVKRKRTYFEVDEPLYGYTAEGGEIKAEKVQGKYALTLSANGNAKLFNKGYNGGDSVEKSGRYLRRNSQKDGVGILEGESYELKISAKSVDFSGSITAYVINDGGLLTDKANISIGGERGETVVTLKGEKTGVGRFCLELSGKGSVTFFRFYFGNTKCFCETKSALSGGKFRLDLVDYLKALKPSFMRFPGGCIVEGYNLKNSYNWKDTVGDLSDRRPKPDLWGEDQKDADYMQSYEIGFYEYFLLCEELKAAPLPIMNAGVACQGRSFQVVKHTEKGFQKYIDDVLDLIEFANGDPKNSKWAKLRAESGHEKPFNLKFIGIGNENWGDDYYENFNAIKQAVSKAYPEIETVFCVGWEGYKCEKYALRRARFDKDKQSGYVDDHFYRKPDWAFQNVTLYDDYQRNSSPVFIGEFAANTPWDEKAMPNSYLSALAEAAFWTGLERNADVVKMTSYAPLFSRVGGEQWKHNLINFNSLTVMPTANYLVQKMYATNFGDTYLLQEKADSDSVYTSATTDGKRVYVKIVNANRENVKATLSINGVERGRYKKTYLSCEDDYARNFLPHSDIRAEIAISEKEESGEFDKQLSSTLLPRSINVFTVELS